MGILEIFIAQLYILQLGSLFELLDTRTTEPEVSLLYVVTIIINC